MYHNVLLTHLGPRRSEVDDINLGLQHFYDSFNVAHARLVSSGVSPHFAPAAGSAPMPPR